MCLTLAALALLPCDARADSYGNPVYGGTGSVTATGAAPAPYASYEGGWGATNSTQGIGGTAQSTGSITTSFTWSGPSQPPQSVIVTETSFGGFALGTSDSPQNHPPSASCSDLGDTGTQAPPVYEPAPPATPYAETLQTQLTATRYSAESGSNPLTLTDAPSASATGNPGTATATVGYMATASAVTITLGGATSDGKGNEDILVGRQCTASVSGIPSALLNNTQNPPVYSWTVSGDNFQSWTASTPPVLASTVLNQSAAAWYWKDQMKTTETVSCSVTLTPPAGQGSAFTVMATQPVTVYVPDWSKTFTVAGSIYVNANCPNYSSMSIYAGPTKGQANQHGGMNWDLIVATPQTPVAFGSGTIELVQLIDTQHSYYTNTGTTMPVQGVQYVSVDNGKTGLDTLYPYAGATASGATAMLGQSDSPDIALSSMIYSASMMDTFTDFLMYEPPGSTQYVPLAQFGWSTSANATIPSPSGNWTMYTGNPGSVKDTSGSGFTANSTFPTWNATYSGSDGYQPAP